MTNICSHFLKIILKNIPLIGFFALKKRNIKIKKKKKNMKVNCLYHMNMMP